MLLIIIKRAAALSIDYLLILIYALLLWLASCMFTVGELNPIEGQLIGFFTLTVPSFCYLYFTEKAKQKGTIGKRIFKISVQSVDTQFSVFTRNVLKLLPWEMAHFGVHWQFYYAQNHLAPPIWVWIATLLPQLIVFSYFISLFFYQGQQTWYDRLAKTKVC